MAMKTIGEIIQMRLKQKNLSRAELAKQLDVSESLITKYINGVCEPPFQNIVKLCQILEINLNKYYSIGTEIDAKQQDLFIKIQRLNILDKVEEYVKFLDYQEHSKG